MEILSKGKGLSIEYFVLKVRVVRKVVSYRVVNIIIDFKLSPCSVCGMLSSG